MPIVPDCKDQSYGLPEDNFKGDYVCEDCRKLDENEHCTAYTRAGQARWERMGHCPLVNRWAEWREDKPKPVLVRRRVGQQKQLKGR